MRSSRFTWVQSAAFVMGDIHTNTIEEFWSLVKGGSAGFYHPVNKKYL
jgi:hypothetical protein